MVTLKQINGARDNEKLFALLAEELQRLLPKGRSATDEFVADLYALRPGWRAMAATFELDVSLALDDLGWHFANWHHLGLARLTLEGLRELESAPLASIFERALDLALAYWDRLGEPDWSDWYDGSPLDIDLSPLNRQAWDLLNKNEMGIFDDWIRYARRYPERLAES